MKILKYLGILILASSVLVIACSSIVEYQRKQSSIERNKDGRLDKIEGDTYVINLNPQSCGVDIEQELRTKSLYKENINVNKKERQIKINGIASHKVGKFPNQGNPNKIKEHSFIGSISLNPEITGHATTAQGFDFGFLFSGVSIDPFTAEFFIGSKGHINKKWNITTLTTTEDLGLDCNNAHVQPTGKYHYHGTPSAYLYELELDGSEMKKIGYAADGFPIYYKYGYADDGTITSHQSGYQLKSGDRPGDGITAPNGVHNGRYFQDYEYIPGVSVLDECNGRWGKTSESDNEYYYIITDNFPSTPICFSGTPSKDFQKGFLGSRPGDNPVPNRGHRSPPPRRGGEE